MDYLNYNNIKDIIDKISSYDKNNIMQYYYKIQKKQRIIQKSHNLASEIRLLGIKFRKFLDDYNIILMKDFNEKEVDNFYKIFQKDVERKKKIYLRYIERLYSYFS